MTYLKYILEIFERISGLKVNFSKSSLAGMGVEDRDISRYAQILRCRVEQWTMKYLGMPLGGNQRSCVFWDPVDEKVNKKLSSWKKSYISLGGRITLIKAALSNLPVYYVSVQDANEGGEEFGKESERFSLGRR